MNVQTKKHPWAGRVLALVAIVVVFGALYLGGILLYLADSGQDSATLQQGNVPAAHLVMHVRVASIDTDKQTASLSIVPEPAGGLTDDNGFSAKKDFTFYVTTVDDAKTVTIKAGDPVTATQITIPTDGDISTYPFDQYTSFVQFDSQLPLSVDASAHIHAYHSAVSLAEHASPYSVGVNYTFERSSSIALFALFVYVLVAVVALVAVVVTFYIVWHSYGLDFAHIGWVAALLFVLPAVRGGLPGHPPIGTLLDFLIFFWAEFLVVLSLVTLAITWVRRSKPSPDGVARTNVGDVEIGDFGEVG